MRNGCVSQHTRLTLLSLIVLALVLLPAPTALASGTWYVDGIHGNDNNNCKSPQTACKTIGHAILLASSGDTINIATAIYRENLTIPFSLTINGAATGTTIIDGGGMDTVVTIPNAGTNVTLFKLTIRNGLTSGNGAGISNAGILELNQVLVVNNVDNGNYPNGDGGGIYNNSGTLTIKSSILSGNSTTYSGGGVYNNSGTLTITNSTLSNNRTTGSGGGIYNFGGTLTITDSTLSGNTGVEGGGAYNGYGATLTITHSTISRNSAPGQNGYGGAIWTGGMASISQNIISGNSAVDGGGGIAAGGTATIINSTISRNRASFAGGGLWTSGTVTISHSIISGNNAVNNNGGGVYNGGTLTISDSTMSGNATLDSDGGAIYNVGTLAVINSTISGNNTPIYGGGIFNGVTLAVTNSTISANRSSFGGGIFNLGDGTMLVANSNISGNSANGYGRGIYIDGGVATLQNSILANSPSGGNCYIYIGSITSNGYNLSSDGTCPFNNTGDLNNTDPVLGPLQDNGGPTFTQALLDGSPAIDAGNPNGCTDGNGNLLKTDQRGFPRPDPEDPSGCDMGAYERQGN